VAAVIVTYQSWRVILWLQTGMLLLGLALSLLFIKFGPTSRGARQDRRSVREQSIHCNPLRVFEMMRYPNILATACKIGSRRNTLTTVDLEHCMWLPGLATIYAPCISSPCYQQSLSAQHTHYCGSLLSGTNLRLSRRLYCWRALV
jgi:hypothetical protein